MVARILLLLLGGLYLANGAAMLIAPMNWYEAVPGVTGTGPFNHHFILDIGMAFITSGGLLALGARAGLASASLAVAGAAWPILHALIHIAGWFTSGFPAEPRLIFSEVVGVVALAALGGVLAGIRVKGETV